MPVINLLTQSDPDKSVDENSASLINMYMVQNNNEGKYPNAAYPTPGLTTFATINTPVRALWEEHNVLYAIGGNTFYSIASNGTPTTLGTIASTTGWAKIVGINNELLITDSTNGYYYNIGSNSFNPIPTGQVIQFITVTNAGSNYVAPTIAFSGGGATTQATGTVVFSGGFINGITITNAGSGYTSTPTYVISDSTGTGAVLVLTMNPNVFPTAIQDIWAQDEFGLALTQNSQQWNASGISDLSTWPALAFASTTGNQNNLVGISNTHRELYLFQQQTTEVWDNVGTANFTFARNQSVYLEWGCAARSSIAKGDNTIYLLGRSISGGPQVITLRQYVPTVISTPAINYQLSTYSTVSDAIGFIYQQEGHEFYVLIFPTANITWVYDMTTQMWHQRQSAISGVQSRWVPQCYTNCYNLPLVGDSQTGNIYQLDMTNFTENTVPITRTLVTHPFYASGAWVYCDRLQIDFDEAANSVSNTLNLSVSRDGGRTYGSVKSNTLAGSGNTISGPRVWWSRLGAAKAYVFKLTTTMNAKFMVLGAWANMRGGEF